MLRKTSSTAFKAILGAVLFASVITVGCNSAKEEAKEEPAKTEEAAPAPAPAAPTTDTTGIPDSAAGKPGAPGN